MGLFSNLFSGKERITEDNAVKRFLYSHTTHLCENWNEMMGVFQRQLGPDEYLLHEDGCLFVGAAKAHFEAKFIHVYFPSDQTARLRKNIYDQLLNRWAPGTEGLIDDIQSFEERYDGYGEGVSYALYARLHWLNASKTTEDASYILRYEPMEVDQMKPYVVELLKDIIVPTSEPFWKKMADHFEIVER
jgi:hypothetical protein